MRANHLEILVEEPSMEAFLRELLPRVIGDEATFEVYPSQGKEDLLTKLPDRLRGYASWLPETWRILVIVDRDDDDCAVLKKKMEQAAKEAGLRTRTAARPRTMWHVVSRIAIEELEAWYFGDWGAVRETYPRVPRSIAEKAAYRSPDQVNGGTWEAFERVLQRAGYFKSGLRKTEVARALGRRMRHALNRSPSFIAFCDAVIEAVS
jgi:hypothetical protein